MSYVGLTGVAAKELDGPMVGANAAEFIKALRKHRVCSTAGDNGAVTAWIDDDGKLRADLCRYRVSIEADTFKTKKLLKKWLEKWLPTIE